MSALQSPYAVHNLYRNPFGELTWTERAELAVVDELDEWLQLLASPRSALQFVGDCGFGKSTRLAAIQHRLPGVEYVYYPEMGPRPPLPSRRPVLVDEANRMGYLQHLRLLRGGGPIVIGSHVDYSRRLRRAGFQVTTVHIGQSLTPGLAAKILNRRIEASRVDAGLPVPRVDEAYAERLLQQGGSNLRRIEHFLYQQFQLSISEQSPWPPAI